MSVQLNVFINCPFDDEYKPTFEAIVFTVSACGYKVRCALEESDSGDIRYSKLCKLIRESAIGIHDLSRTELNPDNLPRFNMPFELGLALGCKQFGGTKHRTKRNLIMVARKYSLPTYLSDLGGNDPSAHENDTSKVIGIVRQFLSTSPEGNPLPGAEFLLSRFNRFRADLPAIAEGYNISQSEVDAFGDYPTFLRFVKEFLSELQATIQT